jgi:hypothetical protein
MCREQQKQIKITFTRKLRRLICSGNACYNAVQDLSSSGLLSRDTKSKIYETITLPGDSYECET